MGGEGRESLVTLSTSLLCKSDKIQQSDPALRLRAKNILFAPHNEVIATPASNYEIMTRKLPVSSLLC